MELGGSIAEFYEAISEDGRVGCSHISLYVALLYLSFTCNGRCPLFIYREQIMSRARISRRTYNKCMSDLVRYGYILYEPSSDPLNGSKVFLNRL